MSETATITNPHAISYNRLPGQWAEGLPLGNGEFGVMVWSDGSRLRLSLDSASAWDLRQSPEHSDHSEMTYAALRRWIAEGNFGAIDAAAARLEDQDALRPTKLPLARLDLDVEFDAASELALDLQDASARGTLQRGEAAHALHVFVCRDRDVLCLRLDPWPDGAGLELIPFHETSPELAALGHPPLAIRREGDLQVAVQHILPDTFLALCWNPRGPEIFISYATGSEADGAASEALEKHPQRQCEAFDGLFEAHREAWAEFWSASAIALPERDLEFLWYFGVYLLASCARRDSNPPGLQGLWAMDGRTPPWRGDYHADMNVQETFWSAGPTNHLELLDVWLDFQHQILPAAEELTREIFGTGGAFWFCSFFPGYNPLVGRGWRTVAFAWSHTGWLAHLAWLRWRYSMDTEWLARRGYPLVRSAFDFYEANLEEGEDGRYHVPLSSSPEYDGPAPTAWCTDPNIDLTLIRQCCHWIEEMEQALGIGEMTVRAREVRERLVASHLVEFEHPASYVRGSVPEGPRVLGLWKGKALDYSHRHPSHLMAIHPAMEITVEGSEREREIIAASLRQYLALGQYCWAGHTYVQMVSMAAVTGRGELAYNFLRQYCDHWIMPNGLHLNREIGQKGDSHFGGVELARMTEDAPFTVETTCGIPCGISDMLLQSWGGRLRIFPAIPERWNDLLFVDLGAEGAFTVSALMREGSVRWVRIVAGVDGPCELRNPFGETDFQVIGPEPAVGEDLLRWQLAAGETVTLHTAGYAQPDLAAEAEAMRAQRGGWLRIGGEAQGRRLAQD